MYVAGLSLTKILVFLLVFNDTILINHVNLEIWPENYTIIELVCIYFLYLYQILFNIFFLV